MQKESRQSIEDRREEVLAAAVQEFAERGLHGSSTESIANSVGISQPYLFKIFGTKKSLFVAALERVFDQVAMTFQIAAHGLPPSQETLDHVGDAYGNLDRVALLMLLQGFAACNDGDIRAVIQRRWMPLLQFAIKTAGTTGDPIQHFFGVGLLATVVRAADLPDEAFLCTDS